MLKNILQIPIDKRRTATMGGVDWAMVASTAALSAVLSILTSLGGLPEVETSAAETADTLNK